MKLKLGIPKGSLENATVDLFRKAGFNISDGIATKGVAGRTPLDEAMLSDPQRPATVRMLRVMQGMDPNAPIPQFAPEASE